MKNNSSLISQITLANGADLVAGVASEILNNNDDVSDTVGGVTLNRDMIYQLAHSSFQIKLNNELKGQ